MRKLKIYPNIRFNQFGRRFIKPEIRLIGNWLKEIGFLWNTEITVKKIKSGSMIINKVGIEPDLIEL